MKGMVYVMKHINVKERFQNKIKDLKKHSKKYYIIGSKGFQAATGQRVPQSIHAFLYTLPTNGKRHRLFLYERYKFHNV